MLTWRLFSGILLLWRWSSATAASRISLMDSTGKWQLPSSLSESTGAANGIVTVVTSPGVPSTLLPMESEEDSPLTMSSEEDPGTLICQGSTLGPLASTTISCLAFVSLVSNVILVEGLTEGDIESGVANTRHARTLAVLFQSRLIAAALSPSQQTLILVVSTADMDEDSATVTLRDEVQLLFDAAAASLGKKNSKLEDFYTLHVRPVTPSSASKLLADAVALARVGASTSVRPNEPLSTILAEALRSTRSPDTVETPALAQARITLHENYLAQSRRVRAVAAAWQSRIARGLCVDAFGRAAADLRQLVLTNFDHATRTAIVLRPAERAELRQQLQQLVDSTIQQAFQGQVTNLEKATLKRFQAALLKTLSHEQKESAESIMTQQAAAMRKEALLFETRMGELEVSDAVIGGCTKDAPLRELAAKLNDAWQAFPDSPAAKLHRTQQVTRVVNQEKAPGERSVRFGLDLVAMLRPDGFGSLQGFAGYQLPGGNSITFGVHNDADDPQVIAQFGGVRPPLLRVQPKLRVDVEL